MSIDSTIACIDIWSSKIRTIIWHFDWEDKNHLNILWVGICDSNAIRKWNILDMEEFKANLDKSLEEAERMSWEEVSGAFISLNSSSLEVITNNWIVAVSWDEITYSDIERVLDMAKNWVETANREILKVIPDWFSVDLESWIKSPVGMSAKKLEVKANIFSINTNILNNIKKSVEDIGIAVYDVFPNLISSPEGVLTKRQKELWVVCIDIWSSTTWITVYEEWTLKFAKVIPIWGDSVTNDIALWVRTWIDVAEKLKLEFGQLGLEKREDYRDFEIDLAKLSKTEEWTVSSLYLSKIIQARYEEILYFVKAELKAIWYDGMLPEWAVLVWGGTKMKWLVELTKESLRLPVTIWMPFTNDNVAWASISDPTFSALLWTIVLANKYRDARAKISFNIWSLFTMIFWSIKKVITKILP